MTELSSLSHGGSSKPVPNKVLLAAFFVLGMGLFAPVASIWQSMDYLNMQFEAYYPSRVLSTGYNMMYMFLIFALFRWGATLWPSKHSRMLTGYLLCVGALSAPPAVDQVLLGCLHLGSSPAAVRGGLAVWSTAAGVAGAADAMISSVIYGEAAAAGLRYTHAFMAGRAASGVVMAALRCISKLAMPPTKLGLLHSTGIYSATAACLVLVCAGIVAWVLPRMQPVLEQLRQHSGVTVQQTLHEIDLAVAKAHATAHTPDTTLPHQRSLATCSTCATMSATPRHPDSSASGLQRQLYRNSYPPDTPSHRRSHHRFGGLLAQGLWPLLPHGLQYSLPQLMQELAAHDLHQHQQHQQLQHQQQLGLTSELATSASGMLNRSPSWVLHIPDLPESHPSRTVLIRASASSLRSSRHSQISSSSVSCSSGDSLNGLEHAGSSSSSCCSPEQLPCEGSDTGAVRQGSVPGDGMLQRHQPGLDSLQSLAAPDKTCHALKLRQGQQPQQTLPVLEKKSMFAPDINQPPSPWLAMKLVYPYQIAAFLPPLITATILPMIMSTQVGQSRFLGSWYIQILVVAIQLGTFAGSALIPVPQPKYPRTTLLTSACTMVLFVVGFAIALKMGMLSVGFIPLAFVMQLYAGYLTTCVFCLTPHGLISIDAELVQQLLVLTTSLSFAAGTSISWAWLAAGSKRCP